MNIRVFKVMFPDGKISFEYRCYNRGCDCGSIQLIAETVKEEVTKILQNISFAKISIDFTPFHDIECPSDLSPRFCMALSEDEKKEFWEYYNS